MDITDVPEDMRPVIAFHGHFCPGITTGYRAAKAAMRLLATERAEDEELVAVVENDSCAVDAIQVLTGCTFGKGNLIFRDYGKQVYTFILRPSGRSVRLSGKVRSPDDPVSRLDREGRTRWMLKATDEELFNIRIETLELPPKAQIRESLVCDCCGEGVMNTRTRLIDGQTLCIPCAKVVNGEGQ